MFQRREQLHAAGPFNREPPNCTSKGCVVQSDAEHDGQRGNAPMVTRVWPLPRWGSDVR